MDHRYNRHNRRKYSLKVDQFALANSRDRDYAFPVVIGAILEIVLSYPLSDRICLSQVQEVCLWLQGLSF